MLDLINIGATPTKNYLPCTNIGRLLLFSILNYRSNCNKGLSPLHKYGKATLVLDLKKYIGNHNAGLSPFYKNGKATPVI